MKKILLQKEVLTNMSYDMLPLRDRGGGGRGGGDFILRIKSFLTSKIVPLPPPPSTQLPLKSLLLPFLFFLVIP